ncbi:uncharacterized protein TRIADDRAFT_58214 [Trichoplax adhaerens]|uniref:Uncharacterized protein n=1 Tax=Trichoplax adhaerens TaxID=10228 RepID=B3S166_TRIAD|nr:predicted protein [Trichoplax adhaerens]EDV23185.1 predicted protein [Trichoplax adhaerens]|eukprot:XP_002114095.1 predicted protein [Trichoplax adhaerens]
MIFGGLYKRRFIPWIAYRPLTFQILNTGLNIPLWMTVVISAWNYPYLYNQSSRYANGVYLGIAFCSVVLYGLITGTLRLNMDALKASIEESKPVNENGTKERSSRSSYYDSSV